MVFAKKRKKTTRRRMQKTPISLLYNILIFSLGFIIVGFVWSFFQNFITEGKIQQDMPVELAGLITATKYEETTGYKIEVEILNGCGVKSLANLYSDFLRDAGFDVNICFSVRFWENISVMQRDTDKIYLVGLHISFIYFL